MLTTCVEVQGRRYGRTARLLREIGIWEDGEVGEAACWKRSSSRAYERKMGEEEERVKK
jgi:hypothetical protein